LLATVISRPHPAYLVTDAGIKALSKDFGWPELVNIPGASVRYLSEEHGVIDLANPEAVNLCPGDKAKAILRAVGDAADVVIYADDIAFQSGPMVSPGMYRRRLRPRQARVLDLLASSGLKVLYHSCGNILSLLGDLVDMGVDAVNPAQVSAGPMGDTAALKREWGDRLAFWGGIDTHEVLPYGSVGDVRAEVRRRITDLASGGGYVLAPVHNIQADVSPQNVCAMYGRP